MSLLCAACRVYCALGGEFWIGGSGDFEQGGPAVGDSAQLQGGAEGEEDCGQRISPLVTPETAPPRLSLLQIKTHTTPTRGFFRTREEGKIGCTYPLTLGGEGLGGPTFGVLILGSKCFPKTIRVNSATPTHPPTPRGGLSPEPPTHTP